MSGSKTQSPNRSCISPIHAGKNRGALRHVSRLCRNPTAARRRLFGSCQKGASSLGLGDRTATAATRHGKRTRTVTKACDLPLRHGESLRGGGQHEPIRSSGASRMRSSIRGFPGRSTRGGTERGLQGFEHGHGSCPRRPSPPSRPPSPLSRRRRHRHRLARRSRPARRRQRRRPRRSRRPRPSPETGRGRSSTSTWTIGGRIAPRKPPPPSARDHPFYGSLISGSHPHRTASTPRSRGHSRATGPSPAK